MKKTLVKKYAIEAPLEDVFTALTDRHHIEEWSGDIADMDARTGGKFSLWNGNIVGKNIEVSKNKILQEWKEETWDEYSRVSMKLYENGNATYVELLHKDIPGETFSHIGEGWDDYFFGPLKEYVEEGLA